MKKSFRVTSIILATLLTITACGKEVVSTPEPSATPTPEVVVVTPEPTPTPEPPTVSTNDVSENIVPTVSENDVSENVVVPTPTPEPTPVPTPVPTPAPQTDATAPDYVPPTITYNGVEFENYIGLSNELLAKYPEMIEEMYYTIYGLTTNELGNVKEKTEFYGANPDAPVRNTAR